jgi:hypothetical protein
LELVDVRETRGKEDYSPVSFILLILRAEVRVGGQCFAKIISYNVLDVDPDITLVCLLIELVDELFKHKEMGCCGINISRDSGVTAYDLAILGIRRFLYCPDPGMPRVTEYVI